MCEVCNFISEGTLEKLQTSLVVIQMVPKKGWRQRRLSISTMRLIAKYEALKDVLVQKLEEDYQSSLDRFKSNPTPRNELFFKELQQARSRWLLKLNEVKRQLENAQPWLSVMEA